MTAPEASHQPAGPPFGTWRHVADEFRMTLDPILQARRAGCRDALIGRGQSPDLAERWCEAWETHAAFQRRERSGEFWQDGRQWIEARLAAANPDTLISGDRTGAVPLPGITAAE